MAQVESNLEKSSTPHTPESQKDNIRKMLSDVVNSVSPTQGNQLKLTKLVNQSITESPLQHHNETELGLADANQDQGEWDEVEEINVDLRSVR